LDGTEQVSDNVWDVDCSNLIPKNASNAHSAYFDAPKITELMRQILRGVDRKIIKEGFRLK
jgi:hypothetical protein